MLSAANMADGADVGGGFTRCSACGHVLIEAIGSLLRSCGAEGAAVAPMKLPPVEGFGALNCALAAVVASWGGAADVCHCCINGGCVLLLVALGGAY